MFKIPFSSAHLVKSGRAKSQLSLCFEEKLRGLGGLVQDSLVCGHFAQQELKSMCKTACSHGEKQNTTPSPDLPSLTAPLTPLTCIAGLVGVKIDWQRLNWSGHSMQPAVAGVLSSDTSQTASRWGAPVKGVQGADRGPPGHWRQSGESKDTPPHSRRPRAEMGNAALCPSCHAEKSVQAQGHLQELDRTPDYYGYHSEEALEPGGQVSSRPRCGHGGLEAWETTLGLQTSWKEANGLKFLCPQHPDSRAHCYFLFTLD